MHTYIGKKNYRWVWIAVNREGKCYMTFIKGDRSTQTDRKLWDKIKDVPTKNVASDYWSAYEDFVPAEGYNCRIRHYLARFHRRTLCYSKSEEMIKLSLKLNGNLPMLN